MKDKIIIVTAFLMFFVMTIWVLPFNIKHMVGEDKEWVGFWGSYLGALFGMVAMIIVGICTIVQQSKFYKRQVDNNGLNTKRNYKLKFVEQIQEVIQDLQSKQKELFLLRYNNKDAINNNDLGEMKAIKEEIKFKLFKINGYVNILDAEENIKEIISEVYTKQLIYVEMSCINNINQEELLLHFEEVNSDYQKLIHAISEARYKIVSLL